MIIIIIIIQNQLLQIINMESYANFVSQSQDAQKQLNSKKRPHATIASDVFSTDLSKKDLYEHLKNTLQVR